jgi:dihydroorotate dehydrogenase
MRVPMPVSLVNTFLAMAIDIDTRRPKLSNIVGGLSGPADQADRLCAWSMNAVEQ